MTLDTRSRDRDRRRRMHHRRGRWAALAQIALIVLGAGTIWLMHKAIHSG